MKSHIILSMCIFNLCYTADTYRQHIFLQKAAIFIAAARKCAATCNSATCCKYLLDNKDTQQLNALIIEFKQTQEKLEALGLMTPAVKNNLQKVENLAQEFAAVCKELEQVQANFRDREAKKAAALAQFQAPTPTTPQPTQSAPTPDRKPTWTEAATIARIDDRMKQGAHGAQSLQDWIESEKNMTPAMRATQDQIRTTVEAPLTTNLEHGMPNTAGCDELRQTLFGVLSVQKTNYEKIVIGDMRLKLFKYRSELNQMMDIVAQQGIRNIHESVQKTAVSSSGCNSEAIKQMVVWFADRSKALKAETAARLDKANELNDGYNVTINRSNPDLKSDEEVLRGRK